MKAVLMFEYKPLRVIKIATYDYCTRKNKYNIPNALCIWTKNTIRSL